MTTPEFYQQSPTVHEGAKRSSILNSKKENEILLSLSEDIARVRIREDLLSLVNNKLKALLPFHHAVIGIIDKVTGHVKAFFGDFSLGRTPELDSYYVDGIPTNNQIIQVGMASYHPLVFDLDKLSKEIDLPTYTRLNYEAGMKELIGVTLRKEDEVLGFFGLYAKNKNSFRDHHLRILQAISSQLTIAVANIIANEQISKKHNENSMLLSLAKDVTSCRTYEDVQDVVLTKLSKYFQYNEVVICLTNSDNLTHTCYGYIDTKKTTSHPGFVRGAAVKYFNNDGVFNVIENSIDPIVLDMEELIKRTNKPAYIDYWHGVNVKEIIGFPLRMNKESIGTVSIYAREKNSFNTESLNLAQAVCSYLGIGLSNIRALEKIKEQLEEINGYKSKLEKENQYLQEEIKTTYNYDQIIGSSNGLRKVFQLVSNVAPSDSTVLLLGETGTGKELIATAIHNSSPRRKNLMVKLNCAALPTHLVESELFGHEKGSFTGALERRTGKFELANKGTLFLDEIGEVSLEIQSKLLRAIQEKEIERIGGNTVIKTDVRIIAASNRDLKNDVEAGKFRRDLFYRLNVFPITLPALRDRTEDIPLLASYFMQKYSQKAGKRIKSISSKVVDELMRYEWPGNVRELEHLIERSVLMTTGDIISSMDLPKKELNQYSPDEKRLESLEDYERAYILSVLKKTNGKIKGEGGAAEILDMPPTTLHSKIKKLGIRKFS
jgi:transcriptional regulator with GAF, ATPase, and Fis domain